MNKISLNKSNEIEAFSRTKQGKVSHTNTKETQKISNSSESNSDNLQFSDKATTFINFVNQLKELPEIRETKVFDLRQQIATGNFNPNADTIADAIIKDES